MVSGDYFSTLGVRAEGGCSARAHGRCSWMSRRGRGLVLGFWQSEFGGYPLARGKAITLDRKPYLIVGVTPGIVLSRERGVNPTAGVRTALSAVGSRPAKHVVPVHYWPPEAEVLHRRSWA